MKPFLKWAGNKYPLRERILPLLKGSGSYIEPFLGSGAIYGSLPNTFHSYYLNDTNTKLTNLFIVVRSQPDELIEKCRELFQPENNNREFYNKIRKDHNENWRYGVDTAAYMLYLNKFGYNGLYRENRKCLYNVPFGRNAKVTLQDQLIRDWSAKLRKESPSIFEDDFEFALSLSNRGDVVYCDPPYYPVSDTSNFTSYGSGGWNPVNDTLRLAKAAREAVQRGAKVVLSNSNTEFVREAFAEVGANIAVVPVRRSISTKVATRGVTTELIIYWRDQHESVTISEPHHSGNICAIPSRASGL